jgi:hypothetical protein
VLERPRKTVAPTPMGFPACDVAALELDGAFLDEVEPGQHVHEGGLAGAVRPDEADDLVPMELERDPA